MNSFCKSQFPHKSVDLFFLSVAIKDRLTDSCGNWLMQNNFINTFRGMNMDSAYGRGKATRRHKIQPVIPISPHLTPASRRVSFFFFFFTLVTVPRDPWALSWVIQESMSLKYEPASEPRHICVRWLRIHSVASRLLRSSECWPTLPRPGEDHLHPEPSTTLNPQPSPLTPHLSTRNPNPETPTPNPEILNLNP